MSHFLFPKAKGEIHQCLYDKIATHATFLLRLRLLPPSSHNLAKAYPTQTTSVHIYFGETVPLFKEEFYPEQERIRGRHKAKAEAKNNKRTAGGHRRGRKGGREACGRTGKNLNCKRFSVTLEEFLTTQGWRSQQLSSSFNFFLYKFIVVCQFYFQFISIISNIYFVLNFLEIIVFFRFYFTLHQPHYG